MRKLFTLVVIVLSYFSTIAQTLPSGFERVIVGGNPATMPFPTVMAFAPDGRIFVAQQAGALRVFKNDALLTTPFITLTVNSSGERGLIGIALDPDFATNNYIYLYYTTDIGGTHNRISRFTADGDVALAGSEQILLELDPLSIATNHNGGALAFGPDGKLYVAIGENGRGANAQDLTTYHGKMLRINKDGSAPSDNPFFATGTERSRRFWAYGLRNPYTFTFHPISGRLLVNDVGQDTWEEVNDATIGGKNYGWPGSEGVTVNPAFTSPIFAYGHVGAGMTGCALTGGAFLSSTTTNYPSIYSEKYFIQDHCSNWIYYFDPTEVNPTATLFGSNMGGQGLSLSLGPDGNLYYLSRQTSRLYRIAYTPPSTPPTITSQPQPVTIIQGQTATFNVLASGSVPFTYQWQKNGVNISGATARIFTINNAQASDAGQYRAVVTNSVTSVSSNEALLTVNPPPAIPVITLQPVPRTVTAGQPATFTVEANGAGALTYQWYRNGSALGGRTQSTLNIASTTAGDAGNYHVDVMNANGNVLSNTVSLTVNVVNQSPAAHIVTPISTDFYRAGALVPFEGTGTDPEDGTLPASAFMWDIHFHHNTHNHDQPPLHGIRSGNFDVPNRGETSSNVWFRFILTVTDSGGKESKDSVDVYPALSTLTFNTVPSGLTVLIDGQPMTTPLSFTSVEGLLRDIGVVDNPIIGNDAYIFSSWSVGGSASQTIATPQNDVTYTANFSIVTGLEEELYALTVYPNPASDVIHIANGDIRSISMVNSIGKTIEMDPVYSGDQTSIYVSHLPPGVYVLFYSGNSLKGKKRVLIR
ncbi:MAG: T9SS type A sorting domain-containing protein [Cyclobacteriaceae bacterium]|nr:T9SS type A sorting domain-containing protein [Cyclobacteriaceae bacterium]